MPLTAPPLIDQGTGTWKPFVPSVIKIDVEGADLEALHRPEE